MRRRGKGGQCSKRVPLDVVATDQMIKWNAEVEHQCSVRGDTPFDVEDFMEVSEADAASLMSQCAAFRWPLRRLHILPLALSVLRATLTKQRHTHGGGVLSN